MQLFKFVRFYTKYNNLLENFLNHSSFFKGKSSSIQNDLINSIASVLINKIKSQINNAKFVSIILDECTDSNGISQMAIVFRYSFNGIVYEHFVGFLNVSENRTSHGLFEVVNQIIEEYNIQNKLCAQTYDGAAVMSGEINGLQRLIKNVCPNAVFVHCYAHCLNLILQKSIQSISVFKRHFSNIDFIVGFFSHSTTRSNKLQKYISQKIPQICKTRWNYISRSHNVIYNNFQEIKRFFNSIVEDSNVWDTNTLYKSESIIKIMEKDEFIIFLEIFSDIFVLTDYLYNILQKRRFDIDFCNRKIKDTLNGIENICFLKYSSICKKYLFKENLELKYNKVMKELFDSFKSQIDLRYGEIEKLKYIELLKYEKYTEFKLQFPQNEFSCLLNQFGENFDVTKLKEELIVIYNDSNFQNKNIFELPKFIENMGLDKIFSETNKLLNLVNSIPTTSASAERSFSCMKRVQTRLRTTQTSERLSKLCILSINKEFLNEISYTKNFYDLIIDEFAKTNRKIDLNYK